MSDDDDDFPTSSLESILRILSMSATLTCICWCIFEGYKQQEKAMIEILQEERRRRAFANTSAARLAGNNNNNGQEDDDPEAMSMRLDQVFKALQFETLTLPSSSSLAPGGGREEEDDDDARTKSTEFSSSCSLQFCREEKDDHDLEQNVASSPSSHLPNLKRASSTSSSSSSRSAGNSTDTMTSILALLVSQWWNDPSLENNVDNDDGESNNCCCICLDTYQPDQIICSPKCLDCNHIFHERCAIRWFQKHDECPMCRTNILQSIDVVNKDDDEDDDSSNKEAAATV